MKAISVSTRYTSTEIRRLDRIAQAVGLSRTGLIRARALGKIVTTHELADWAEARLASSANRRGRHAPHAA